MVSVVSKARVPVAAPKKSKFSVPSVHITTQGFMKFFPSYVRPIIKDTHLKCHHDTFVRTSPLDKPFYGDVKMHNRAFFVPYRVCWEPFEDFRNDVPHNQPDGTSIIPRVPGFTAASLLQALTSRNAEDWFGYVVPVGQNCDILASTGQPFVFNTRGRAAVSFIESLGYKVFNTKTLFRYSALNLLAAAKVYLDWYYPNQYAHYGVYASIDGIMQRQVTYDLTPEEIRLILDAVLFVCYDSDFFTSLWDNPTAPSDNVGSDDFVIHDVTGRGLDGTIMVDQIANGTPELVSRTGEFTGVTQYNIESLRALTSYVKRHQLSGSLSLNRALSQYGVMLDAEKLRRCYYLGSDDFELHVGDVTSTAETEGASLGSYAGKAIASSAKDFEMHSDEDGVFLVISTIIPRPLYWQGIDKNVINQYKLDFHNPEFDALSVDVVRQAEVFVQRGTNQSEIDDNDYLLSGFFGFASRYYSHKIGYDRVTGDFTFSTVNSDLLGWFLSREIHLPTSLSNFKHNFDFVRGLDAGQYNNVFLLPQGDEWPDAVGTDIAPDPFFVVHRDNVQLLSPMRHLYDDVVFDDEKSSKSVIQDPNGVKLN